MSGKEGWENFWKDNNCDEGFYRYWGNVIYLFIFFLTKYPWQVFFAIGGILTTDTSDEHNNRIFRDISHSFGIYLSFIFRDTIF